MKFIKKHSKTVSDLFCDKIIDIFNKNEWDQKPGVSSNGLNKKVKDSTDLNLTMDLDGVTSETFRDLFSFIEQPIIDYLNMTPTRDGKENNLSKEAARYFHHMLQPPIIKKYIAPGGGYHAWHSDLGIDAPANQRLLVAMVYLNDVDEGGETSFWHQDLKIKPEKGTLVIFPPYYTHLHRGERPISNNKYILNCYIGLDTQAMNSIPREGMQADKLK